MNCLQMSLGASMNETLLPKEFRGEDGKMSASNGVEVPAIRQAN